MSVRKEDCAGRLSSLSGITQLTLAGELRVVIAHERTEGDRRKWVVVEEVDDEGSKNGT